MNKVLLVNTDLTPIGIIPWTKAVTMFILEKVDIYKEGDKVIRSEKLAIPKPLIVRLKKYKYIKYFPRLSKLNIFLRDQYSCQYCGVQLTTKTATLDHIVPRSKGGTNDWTNIVTCCKECNCKKADKTLEEIGFKLLNKPEPLFSVKFNINRRRNL